MIKQKIKEIAEGLIGVQEIPENQGFESNQRVEEFLKTQGVFGSIQSLYELMGWRPGESWCAYTAELVWKIAYSKVDTTILKDLDKLFSAGAVQTYNNFLNSEFKVQDKPEIGAVVLMQNYKKGKADWTGHAGIVVDFGEDWFTAVEGNTNDEGKREGYEICKRTRKLDYKVMNGLRVKGFVIPKES